MIRSQPTAAPLLVFQLLRGSGYGYSPATNHPGGRQTGQVLSLIPPKEAWHGRHHTPYTPPAVSSKDRAGTWRGEAKQEAAQRVQGLE